MRMTRMTILSFFLLLPAFTQGAENDLSPSASLSKVDFVKEIPIPGTQKLLGWSGDNFYLAKQDGSVQVIDKEGRTTITLQAKNPKGDPVLERPEAVAVADGTAYVVDRSTHLVAMFSPDGKYKGSFGAKGSDPSELLSPRGIAVYEGIVYVADTSNRRIQLFGNNGVFLTTLEIATAPENEDAKVKNLPYKLGEPIGIAIDAAGLIYVLDASDSLIKIYNQNGAYLRSLPQNGKPVAISVALDGIYVADQSSYTIQKYYFSGKMTNFGSQGEGLGQFKSFSGLAADNGRQVFVGDAKKGVMQAFQTEAGVALDPASRQVTRPLVRWQEDIPATVGKIAWNGKDTIYGINKDSKSIVRIRNGVMEGEIKAKDIVPVSIAVDKGGALWVLDKKKARVVKLDDGGNILTSFGTEGSGPGQLDEPTDIVVSSSGVIFIADRGNHCVQAFNSDGVFLKMIRNTVADKLEKPIALAIGLQDDILYVLDKGRSTVSTYSSKGEPLAEFGKTNSDDPGNLSKPVGVMATRDEVLVVDTNRVKVYSPKGKYIRSFGAGGRGFGEFDEPVSIALKDDTAFFISDSGNKRIQALTTIHKPGTPVKITARAGIHYIELQWPASANPYIERYQIYRSKKDNSGFVLVGTSKTNQYTDSGLNVGEKYFYRLTMVSQSGYESPASAVVSETAMKYIPAAIESAQVETTPWQIKMRWKPFAHQYFANYVIYQKNPKENLLVKLGETTEPEFVKDALLPETSYVFYVATRSTDGVESEKLEVKATTQVSNKPPLEISILEMHNIFSNTYKLYEQEGGVGQVKLTNYTSSPMQNIKVSFMLKNFMDFPTETMIDSLMPLQSKELVLKAVFNNAILSLTEDTSVQAQVEASYFENSQPKLFNKISSVNVYDKHRLTWDERGRYAAFITPKDAPTINLTRAVSAIFKEVNDDAQRAAAVFDTLGALGLNYVQDPANPYQITSSKTDVVDYIQYPRETMERKAGDCDDLVAVYTAALESISIPTLVLEVPGHMFMMFSTGIPADADGYTMEDMYVIYQDMMWIPVETTMVGKPFVKAWEQGAKAYYEWEKKRQLSMLDVHEAWETYKPASLPESSWKPGEVSRESIEKRFPGDYTSMLKISAQTKTRRYLQAIKNDPSDMDAHLQVGIILAKAGDNAEAMEYFDKVISVQPKNAAALNNRGNILMLQELYPEAQNAYLAATAEDPEDAEIWVNLVKSYQATKDAKKAKAAFIKAQELDPTVKKRNKAIALELLNAL